MISIFVRFNHNIDVVQNVLNVVHFVKNYMDIKNYIIQLIIEIKKIISLLFKKIKIL